jgi:PiT family inorganic phosphate transporter
VVLASVFNVIGPLVVGAAVAETIGGIATLAPVKAIQVIGAGLLAAVGWNVVTWWLGLPSSSGHALVGLVGAGRRRAASTRSAGVVSTAGIPSASSAP